MAGPNLELFKFGLYLFFPLAVMVHYGDPEWYHKNVLPIRDTFWPKEKSLYKPPRNESDLKAELAELRKQRMERKAIRETQPSPDGGRITSAAPTPISSSIVSALPVDHEGPNGVKQPTRKLIPRDPLAANPSPSVALTLDHARRQRLV